MAYIVLLVKEAVERFHRPAEQQESDMGNRPDRSKTAVKTMILGALALAAAGCAGTSNRLYMPTLRNYPGCVSKAQISQTKVDGCMGSTDQASFNACLVSKNVPQSKIDVLNACVDSHRRSTIGNLF
jgi:hypothetical protein